MLRVILESCIKQSFSIFFFLNFSLFAQNDDTRVNRIQWANENDMDVISPTIIPGRWVGRKNEDELSLYRVENNLPIKLEEKDDGKRTLYLTLKNRTNDKIITLKSNGDRELEVLPGIVLNPMTGKGIPHEDASVGKFKLNRVYEIVDEEVEGEVVYFSVTPSMLWRITTGSILPRRVFLNITDQNDDDSYLAAPSYGLVRSSTVPNAMEWVPAESVNYVVINEFGQRLEWSESLSVESAYTQLVSDFQERLQTNEIANASKINVDTNGPVSGRLTVRPVDGWGFASGRMTLRPVDGVGRALHPQSGK